jgi:Kef-type K+ transport system membrane component KefB
MSTVLDTSQVEAEVKPFKGILLGLFFLCTGAAVDIPTLFGRFPTIALLTIGLISVKFTITSVSARFFGLTEAESVKVGLTLSQGGEFAFVLLALAQDLRVLPEDLNALLICVVVLSMALTPLLAEVGEKFEAREAQVCSTILVYMALLNIGDAGGMCMNNGRHRHSFHSDI